ncbi:MAG: hypothetical protein U0414_14255 [Polyangiaceae bacterium]
MSAIVRRENLFALALAALLAACSDPGTGNTPSASATTAQSTTKAPPSASSAKKEAWTPPPPPSAAPGADELAGLTTADYEDEAEQAITIENLDAEIAKIEAEIHAK